MAHDRFHDVALLLLAVVIALVLRGVPRHKVLLGLEDAGWAALAVGLYLPIVFVAGGVSAFRALRGWRASHQAITQGVMLALTPRVGPVTTCETRCVVTCEDGSQHEANGHRDGTTGSFLCHYNSGFRSTGIHPPHGDHLARWFIKESPSDGWIKVAEDPFTYAPLSQPPAAEAGGSTATSVP